MVNIQEGWLISPAPDLRQKPGNFKQRPLSHADRKAQQVTESELVYSWELLAVVRR